MVYDLETAVCRKIVYSMKEGILTLLHLIIVVSPTIWSLIKFDCRVVLLQQFWVEYTFH